MKEGIVQGIVSVGAGNSDSFKDMYNCEQALANVNCTIDTPLGPELGEMCGPIYCLFI